MERLSTAMAAFGLLAAIACLTASLSGYASEESDLEKSPGAFVKAGDYENALKLVEGFMLENPQEPIGHAMSAKVLAANGQTKKALKAYYQFYKLGDAFSEELLLELLLGALDDDSSEVRSFAAEALGTLGDKSAVPHLIKILNDDGNWVRWETAEVLGELGDKSAIPALINALNDTRWVRLAPAGALVRLGDKRAESVLINALNHDDSVVRWTAAKVLDKLGDGRGVPVLINALNHDNGTVRANAAGVLGKLGDNSAVDPLINALNDKNILAAEALGKLGDERAVPALINALNDDYLTLRLVAAEALGKLGDKRGIPVLINAVKHNEGLPRLDPVDENLVVWSAATALAALGNKRTVPTLMEILGDDNQDIQIKLQTVAIVLKLNRSTHK